MPIFFVTQPVDYVIGYITKGHREGYIQAESFEDAVDKIKKNPDNYLDLIIDDYTVDRIICNNEKFQFSKIE